LRGLGWGAAHLPREALLVLVAGRHLLDDGRRKVDVCDGRIACMQHHGRWLGACKRRGGSAASVTDGAALSMTDARGSQRRAPASPSSYISSDSPADARGKAGAGWALMARHSSAAILRATGARTHATTRSQRSGWHRLCGGTWKTAPSDQRSAGTSQSSRGPCRPWDNQWDRCVRVWPAAARRAAGQQPNARIFTADSGPPSSRSCRTPPCLRVRGVVLSRRQKERTTARACGRNFQVSLFARHAAPRAGAVKAKDATQ